MRFEWDERKRQANLAKHGLDLRRAVRVFDRPSFTYPSPKLDEARWVTVGEARGRLVAVVWTWRSGAIRVTSMRRARREESRRHRELHGRRTAGNDRAR
jgi:uncharacterized protein